jgi:hypothetical protein
VFGDFGGVFVFVFFLWYVFLGWGLFYWLFFIGLCIFFVFLLWFVLVRVFVVVLFGFYSWVFFG